MLGALSRENIIFAVSCSLRSKNCYDFKVNMSVRFT